MTIQRGDFVRPNNPSVGLPLGSVWRVVCADGSLKLEWANNIAHTWRASVAAGRRFPVRDFDKMVLSRGGWVSARDEELLPGPTEFSGDWTPTLTEAQPNSLISSADAVAKATIDAELAASATAAIARKLEDARKLEAERKAELQAAKAAKAKADKEAAARSEMEEARKALAAKLYADRCLAEATLELIAEVSRLNNGGSERVAGASIAQHIDQLQALAKSYGYRIVKPSLLAQVVKL